MATALDRIIDYKHDEVAALKQACSLQDLLSEAKDRTAPRGFRQRQRVFLKIRIGCVRHIHRRHVELFSGRDYRSEEHTSELQSHSDLVCRLLLEKKNNTTQN